MLAALLAAALGADPVIAVQPFVVHGGSPELGLALTSIVEDDLATALGAVRFQAEVDAAKQGRAQARGATYLVTGVVAVMGEQGRVALQLVDVESKRAAGGAALTVTGGDWGADRARLVTGIAKAAGLKWKGEPKTPVYPKDAVLAWGAALKDGSPEAIAAFAKKWPEFGPAKRRLAK